MGLNRKLNRRTFAGGAAALAIGTPLLARAQQKSDAQATADANATATVEAKGIQVSTEEKGKTNVTWWTHNNTAFVEANKQMMQKFEQENPDIHIVYQYFPYDVYVRKLQTGYRSGSVADMQQMFGTWVTEYAKNGLLDQVPDNMASNMKERFWEPSTGAYQWQDKFYGQPKEYNLENGGMLVNPKLLTDGGVAAPPKIWQELVDDAVKLTKHDGKKVTQSGFAFINGDSVTFLFLSMILQQGATYWADDKVHIDFSTDAAKKAWQDQCALTTKYNVDNTQSYTGDTYELFFRGGAAMAMRGPWVIAVGKEQFPEFKFSYVPMPPYAGTEMKFAAESGWGEVVNKKAKSEIKTAAWKFIDFMHRDENLRAWNIATFTVPSLKSLQNDPQILQVAPDLKTSFAVLPSGQWVGPVQDRDRFWQTLTDAFTNTALGRKQPLDALKEAEKQINAMIDEKVGP